MTNNQFWSPRIQRTLFVCVFLAAASATAQIREIWQYEGLADERGGPIDDLNSRSRANFIKSSLPGHLGLDGSGTIVTVSDVQYQGETHIDLIGRHEILPGPYGFRADPRSEERESYHGTFTAGIVGGNGNRHPRFVGLASGATIYSGALTEHQVKMDFVHRVWIKSLDFRPESLSGINQGLRHTRPSDIFSNSFVTKETGAADELGRYNSNSRQLDSLIIRRPDKLFVRSAGNTGTTQPGYPRNYLTVNPSQGSAKNSLVVGRHHLGGPAGFIAASSFGP
ncbi:MAG: S8 family serine peptidase, partial [bacterium]|nr:S8 family serine peptidase [bacterium]